MSNYLIFRKENEYTKAFESDINGDSIPCSLEDHLYEVEYESATPDCWDSTDTIRETIEFLDHHKEDDLFVWDYYSGCELVID